MFRGLGKRVAKPSQAWWLALCAFLTRHLGWRSYSLWLVELTPGYYIQHLRRKESNAGLSRFVNLGDRAQDGPRSRGSEFKLTFARAKSESQIKNGLLCVIRKIART
jgi:hypothetical protein